MRGARDRRVYRFVGLTIGGASAALGVAFAAGVWSSPAARSPRVAPRSHAATVGGYSPALQAAFSAFARASSASDELPASVQANVSRQAPGAEIALSRRILTDHAGAVYLVPAREEVCAVIVGSSPSETSQACSPDGAAAARGFFSVAGAGGIGSSRTITGVAPSGVTTVTLTTASGEKASAQVTADGGYRLAFAGAVADLRLSGTGKTIDDRLSPTPERGGR
jgi:hypothetical protein